MPPSITADAVDSQGTDAVFLPLSEVLRNDSPLYPGYTERPYNPDIIAKKRPPFGIYDDMRRDDQVKAVLWMKKFMVLSSGWQFEQDDTSETPYAEVLTENLAALESPDFGDVLVNMLTYLDYGFSVVEPVFRVTEGPSEQRVVIDKIKPKAPHSFYLHTDDFGNLTQLEQTTSGPPIFVTPDKVMMLTHQAEFGIPYGVSDLQSCYRAWFCKDQVIKFWMIHLERFGNPWVVATLEQNIQTEERTRLDAILKNWQSKASMRVPAGVKIDLKGSPTGTTDFESAIDNCNMMIARSLLMPDLMGISGEKTGGGSYSLGEKQFELFFLTLEKIRQDIARLMNRRVIQPLCWWNWGVEPRDCPKWQLRPLTLDDESELHKMWSEAVRGRVWTPSDEEIQHFQKSMKYPVTKGAVDRPQVLALDPSDEDGAEDDAAAEARESSPRRHGAKRVAFSRELSASEKKTDFSAIAFTTARLDSEALNALAPPLAKIREGLVETILAKHLVDRQQIGQLDSLALKYLKDLQLAWKGILRRTLQEGQASAQSELPQTFADDPVPTLFETTLTERSFFLTGVMRDDILKKARQVILGGIEAGSTMPQVVERLGSVLNQYYAPDAPQLETIIRTNITKTYNYGRRTVFEDTALDGFVIGYLYSAILDDRTTDVCRALDGKKFGVDDPYVDAATPPRHHNCRSLWIPVTQDEAAEFVPDAHPIPETILAEFSGKL